MISFITGKVIDINKTDITVITNGSVGYKVNIASSNKYLLEQEVSLFIYTSVKESEISLWGFQDKLSLSLFENLISVSGVGTKTAMNLIDVKGFATVINAIIKGNFEELKVSGLGPKTAQKIVIELRTKLAKFVELNPVENSESNFNNKNVKIYYEDALEALTSLGYREQDIKNAYSKLGESELNEIKNSPDLVRILLKFI